MTVQTRGAGPVHSTRGGSPMRDLRGDLQDRADMVEQQINAEHAQFDNLIKQLKREQDSRLEDLKATALKPC